MASRAQKRGEGVIGILKLLWTLCEQSSKLFFKLFDCQIQPMLTYGSEVWGLIADHSTIERVIYLPKNAESACLQRNRQVPIVYLLRCIKYWLNVLRIQEDRLPMKSDKMLYNLHCDNKNNWASSVCFTLYRYGFGHLWENQGVCDVRSFLCEFRQRLIDRYHQGWNSDISSEDRYAFFSWFKQTHGLFQYLLTVQNVALKRNLIKLRLGVSS